MAVAAEGAKMDDCKPGISTRVTLLLLHPFDRDFCLMSYGFVARIFL